MWLGEELLTFLLWSSPAVGLIISPVSAFWASLILAPQYNNNNNKIIVAFVDHLLSPPL